MKPTYRLTFAGVFWVSYFWVMVGMASWVGMQ